MKKLFGYALLVLLMALTQCSNSTDPASDVSGTSGKKLIVTEILYNNAADTLEFIEIKNVSGAALSMKGMSFTEGVVFTFPDNMTIEKGGYCVLTNSQELFLTHYPSAKVGGVYTGSLDNKGEELVLTASDLTELFSVVYETKGFWPSLADGLGYSLITVDESDPGDQNDFNDWRASTIVGGTPGAVDKAAAQSPVYVNEVIVSGLTDRIDTVELYNPSTTQPVDISYWFLTDDRKFPKKYQIPSGTVLSPKGYKIITAAAFGDSISISTVGGSLYLFAAKADGSYTGFSQGIDYVASDAGTSHGLVLNSDSLYFTSQLKMSTIGSANAMPTVGTVVISEIMYHPVDGGTEFIEIANTSNDSVQLFTQGIVWDVEGVSFEFLSNVTLKKGGILLLVDSTTVIETFRATNSIDTSVVILQFNGKLSNSGELVTIEKPSTFYYDEFGALQYSYITVDAVSYKDSSPWPEAADGDGYSLQRKDLSAWGCEPTNWRASDAVGGTPGKL